jgi:hypothetical protein
LAKIATRKISIYYESLSKSIKNISLLLTQELIIALLASISKNSELTDEKIKGLREILPRISNQKALTAI